MSNARYKLIQEFKDVIKEDTPFVVRSAISPLFMMITWQEEVYPLHIFCITKGRDMCISLSEKKYVAIATHRFREYFQGKVSIQELQSEYDSWEKDTAHFYDEVMSKDIGKLSDAELCDCMFKINELFRELAKKTLYIENVDLEKILSVTGFEYKDKINAIWERATEAVFIYFESRRLKKILDIISSDDSNLIRKAKFMYTDYFWTKSPEEISDAINKIKQNVSVKSKEYEQACRQVHDKKIKHDEWLMTLDDESRKIAEFIQLVMHMRDVRKDPLAQIQALMAEISVVMLERAGVDAHYAPFVILCEYLKGVKFLSSIKEDIKNRSDGCIYLVNPDMSYKTEKCNFEEALKQFTETIEHKIEETDTLKGQVACKGVVRGIVRVVLDHHNDKGFIDGDVLVTSMTRPEFVPIMKKAGAVITNEGGVTCHAAIVSRELKIPCIIGTKIATQVLKDGDLVEVDADNGVIKKI